MVASTLQQPTRGGSMSSMTLNATAFICAYSSITFPTVSGTAYWHDVCYSLYIPTGWRLLTLRVPLPHGAKPTR